MTKGKNFSCNNTNGKRKKSDFYETPYSLTRLLLDNIKLTGSILEPACGSCAIVNVLQKYGYMVECYDIDSITYYGNFLQEQRHYDTIITNPPYSLAYEFIQKAKTVCDRFIFLLPLAYLHGKQRYDNIWMDKSFPLKNIWVFTRYPLLGEPLREDGKHNTGMMVYAWFEWEKKYIGQPKINWLDNNPYILKKGE